METVVMVILENSNGQAYPKGNAIDHYVTLIRSPLLLAPIVDSFFQEIKPSEKNILLGYLVLPIVLYPTSRNFLVKANSNSSVRTFCSERSRLAGLQKRATELRITSCLAMQNSIDCARLILNPDLSLEYVENESKTISVMPLEIKAAKRLAVIFEPYDVTTIYRLLGVNNL
jgi:Family of unknown function (DUF6521)